ncbi:MAG: zinc ribbon domain-containing protein, partial [Clostridia bacterium]|nr:zinc ribbon domain-containing protein [Clostridia bacterium]
DDECCECDECFDEEDYDGYETECPVCGKTVFFDDEDDPEDVVCPSCGEHFSCVCDGDCEECGDPCPVKDEE